MTAIPTKVELAAAAAVMRLSRIEVHTPLLRMGTEMAMVTVMEMEMAAITTPLAPC
jgi:hypothetical protein